MRKFTGHFNVFFDGKNKQIPLPSVRGVEHGAMFLCPVVGPGGKLLTFKFRRIKGGWEYVVTQ